MQPNHAVYSWSSTSYPSFSLSKISSANVCIACVSHQTTSKLIVFRKPSKLERKAGTEFRLDTCVSSKHCGLCVVKCLHIGGCTAFETINCVPESTKKAVKIVTARGDQPRVRLKDDIIARLQGTMNTTKKCSPEVCFLYTYLTVREFLSSFLSFFFFINPWELKVDFVLDNYANLFSNEPNSLSSLLS